MTERINGKQGFVKDEDHSIILNTSEKQLYLCLDIL